MPDDPRLRVATQTEWWSWLEANGTTSSGVWLELARKGSPVPTPTYAEAIESALCHGWIDGQKRALDADLWLQRFTRRGQQSRWSKINRDKATALIASGQMQPAGHAEVERARADGRWERAYAGAATIEVPADLRARLDETPAAAEFFATLNGVNRYAVLYRIQDAKRPETRARRIETFVEMLARGEKLHP
ncbi:MAG TPA: YdeI/OmpD-associated family protein [Gaiellales bacterium]|jgi:uncharacterized protein YdeI (YjbR/CyaY-like superfamily)